MKTVIKNVSQEDDPTNLSCKMNLSLQSLNLDSNFSLFLQCFFSFSEKAK